jgi:hypothetical protein
MKNHLMKRIGRSLLLILAIPFVFALSMAARIFWSIVIILNSPVAIIGAMFGKDWFLFDRVFFGDHEVDHSRHEREARQQFIDRYKRDTPSKLTLPPGVHPSVMTEANRIARERIKEMMKAQGLKWHLVRPKDIASAANGLLESDPEIMAEAEANIRRRYAHSDQNRLTPPAP